MKFFDLTPDPTKPELEWTRPDGVLFKVGSPVLCQYWENGEQRASVRILSRIETKGLGYGYEKAWVHKSKDETDQLVPFPSLKAL